MILVNSIRIPYINNAILKPGYTSNSTLIVNKSYDQCLCLSSLSYPAINWFPNNTCQLFFAFPPTYRIEMTAGARLYFPQQSFPNASQCCMPDINYLLNKMKQATLTFMNVTSPRDVIIDDLGYLVTVEMEPSFLHRFDATNLTTISRNPIQNSFQMTIAYNQGAYFIAPINGNVMAVIDSTNLTSLSNITMTAVNGPRGILFLNSGQTMVVTSFSNNNLVFFNRSSLIPIQYTFAFSQLVHYANPHGLYRVNDSFFYVTSYFNKSIYSYSTAGVNAGWNEKFVLNLLSSDSAEGSTSMTMDECGRFWFPLQKGTVLIYDQQGNLLGNYTAVHFAVSFMKIMDNYVMYFSDSANNQIIRLDPHIQC